MRIQDFKPEYHFSVNNGDTTAIYKVTENNGITFHASLTEKVEGADKTLHVDQVDLDKELGEVVLLPAYSSPLYKAMEESDD